MKRIKFSSKNLRALLGLAGLFLVPMNSLAYTKFTVTCLDGSKKIVYVDFNGSDFTGPFAAIHFSNALAEVANIVCGCNELCSLFVSEVETEIAGKPPVHETDPGVPSN